MGTERYLGAVISIKGINAAAANEIALNKGPRLLSFPDRITFQRIQTTLKRIIITGL